MDISAQHKQESEELEKKIQEMLAGAKSKNERKRINKEAEQMRKELFEKYQSLEVDSSIASIAEMSKANAPAEQVEEPAEPQKKKRTNAKAQREKKLKAKYQLEAAALKAASEITPGQIETEKLTKQIEPLGLVIRQVTGDGHCLFRAVVAAMTALGRSGYNADSYLDLRKSAANEIMSHPDQYLPFSNYGTVEELEKHCKLIETTAEWGDNLEVSALANALHVSIIVHSVGVPPQKYGEFAASINLTFHSTFTSHGGHYNAAIPKIE
ncbi:OTU-like cysteine protease family protein [Trichomonas vaginalis G3]|uniref:OTU-like cysteine protease family protein n=1 Tax=Trichomonas vaginalis (strain ATCC PRA-98 / G3) TaxID=412133 RepID=A2DJL7_TRIV3|nr:ubiquitinyl hydrolase protein [Trichomonas vaginalis G3]EAY19417.1 OTU-like cysteine protease family protein [Trichomonas vaginalis G3]KAI5493185.1 ubiquitinyl hydrolase protein [Trichomonas vaginalis G3]|eukprot:XP_001580403.1 OTU-like cysteine protease family protein [Trichomonas vaginalis G3]